jgi:hypothetical protein
MWTPQQLTQWNSLGRLFHHGPSHISRKWHQQCTMPANVQTTDILNITMDLEQRVPHCFLCRKLSQFQEQSISNVRKMSHIGYIFFLFLVGITCFRDKLVCESGLHLLVRASIHLATSDHTLDWVGVWCFSNATEIEPSSFWFIRYLLCCSTNLVSVTRKPFRSLEAFLKGLLFSQVLHGYTEIMVCSV